jgi:hypothetical protein
MLAIASPALVCAQVAPQESAAAVPPVQAVPGVGAASAALPGAGMPGDDETALSAPPAQLTSYGIAAGVGETDNIDLTAKGRSQTMAAANVDFDLRRSGSLLEASALGNFSDINYLQGAYGNQVLGRFDGLATAKLWSDRLKWIFADDFGDQQLDPFAAVVPTNLQRVNVFTTGPDLTLRPSYSTFVTLDGRYSKVNYQTSPFDGDNLSGSVEFGRQLSPLASLSMVVEAEKLRFTNTVANTNYSRREAYGHYQIQGARTSIDAQLGATQADDVGSWRTTPYAHLELTRKLSPFSLVTLAGGREYTDSGGSFASLRAGAGGGITVAPAAQSSGNYLRNYGSLGWQFARLRTSFGVTGNYEQDEYDRQSLLDVNRASVGLNLGRKLTPQLSASLTATLDRYEYLHEAFTDKFGTAGATLTYRPGRWFIVYVQYEHEFRRPSGAQAALVGGGDYDENRAFLMIGYRPRAEAGGAGQSGFGGMPAP